MNPNDKLKKAVIEEVIEAEGKIIVIARLTDGRLISFAPFPLDAFDFLK